MARQKSADHVESLRRQQAEIAQKLKQAEAKERERLAADTRRARELAGAAILTRIDSAPESDFAKAARDLLRATIKKPTDRALFPFMATSPESTAANAPRDTPEPSA